MSLPGFNGQGNQFVDRFGAGEVISAGQLNDLINGISTALPQPYIGDGTTISYGSGGTQITSNNDGDYLSIFGKLNINFPGVNHWEVKVVFADIGDGILGFRLKVAQGGNIWRPVGADCDEQSLVYRINYDPSLTLVAGTDPTSPWAEFNGFIPIVPETFYCVYAYKIERENGETLFYNYVAQNSTLADSCPVTIPLGIPTPTGNYNVQALKVATATWVVYTAVPQFAISQNILGSIAWPQTVQAITESVNHFQLTIKEIDDSPVLKIASGGHIYRLPSKDCDDTDFTEVITPDPSNPAPVTVVNGTEAGTPWASNDGYVPLYGGNYYIYAYKVETETTATFYIYVSKISDLDEECPTALRPGITDPAVDYTIQCLKIGSAEYVGGEWVVEQRLIGSITWPQTVVEPAPEQFKVKLEVVDGETVVKIARGNAYGGIGFLPPNNYNAQGQSLIVNDYGFKIRNVAAFPTGASTTGTKPTSPWVNNNGHIKLDSTATASYGVFLVRNVNNKTFGSNSLAGGKPYLAVIKDLSAAATKTAPFYFAGFQTWCNVWLYSRAEIRIDETLIDINGEAVEPTSYGTTIWATALINYNCQRLRIASIVLDGLPATWSVEQHILGPINLNHPYKYGGVHKIRYSSTNEGYPSWWSVPDYGDKQDEWEGDWAGYTKLQAGATDTVPT